MEPPRAGWPLSHRAWESQTWKLLEAGHRVIAYDRRGFGDSSRPWNGYNYDTLAADLDALIGGLDLSDVTLVGFSMGGGEVARYVGNHGTARVAGVVFASAVPPYLYAADDNPDGALDDATIEEFREGVQGDRIAFLDQFVSDFFNAGDGSLVSDQMHHFVRGIAAQVVPFEASGKRTAEAIDGAELTTIEGGPHGCSVTHTKQFNDALVEFLTT